MTDLHTLALEVVHADIAERDAWLAVSVAGQAQRPLTPKGALTAAEARELPGRQLAAVQKAQAAKRAHDQAVEKWRAAQ